MLATVLLMLTLESAGASDVTIDLSVAEDATAVSNQPDLNFGSDSRDWVRSGSFVAPRSDVFLKFDLSSIPAGTIILEARLTMTAFSGFAWGGDGTVYTHFVPDDGWSESTITWNNQPAASAEVLGSWWLWYDQTDNIQIGTTSTAAFAARVQAEAEGDDRLSLRLHSPGYDTEYRSREYPDASQRPTLTVRYTDAPTAVSHSSWGTLKARFR